MTGAIIVAALIQVGLPASLSASMDGVPSRSSPPPVAVAVPIHPWLPASFSFPIDGVPPRGSPPRTVITAPAGAPSQAEKEVMSVTGPITEHPLTRLRELYYAAVDDREAIGVAMEEIDLLRRGGNALPGSRRAAVLDAYGGALTTLRAKHGRWPPDRLRHLNGGLRRLDSAVDDAPDVVEIRYLRLMSCYYLPGILGRGASVREDFEALARLLPDAAAEFPPALYRAILTFVVEHGEVEPSQQAALESALRSLHADAG